MFGENVISCVTLTPYGEYEQKPDGKSLHSNGMARLCNIRIQFFLLSTNSVLSSLKKKSSKYEHHTVKQIQKQC